MFGCELTLDPGLQGGQTADLERETGFEPATSSLARKHSTTELLPLDKIEYSKVAAAVKTAADACPSQAARTAFCKARSPIPDPWQRIDSAKIGTPLNTFVADHLR